MRRDEILKQVNDIFIDVLENDDVIIQESTTANDVDDWDSLNHLQLIVAIERHFKIRFSSNEIQSWNNVSELLDSIQNKRS